MSEDNDAHCVCVWGGGGGNHRLIATKVKVFQK